MTELSRRTFLRSAVPASVVLAAATTSISAIAAAADQASPTGTRDGPKFRLGIVTYNIAAALGPADDPEGVQGRRHLARSSCARRTSTASSRR